MIELPRKTLLGKLTIVVVFEHFDIPRLFLCKNATGSYFLVLSLDDDVEADEFEWLYLPVTSSRIRSLLSKNIQLIEAFLSPEDEYLYRVLSTADGEAEVSHVLPESLTSDDLPLEGTYLQYPEEGVSTHDTESNDLQSLAVNARREIFNFHVKSESISGPELSARKLATMVNSFQDLMDSLGQYCEGEVTLKGAISAQILNRTQMNASNIFDGSFGIQFMSDESGDLFDSSLISDSLYEFKGLLDAGDDEDLLSNRLHELKGRVASKYRRLLKDLVRLDSKVILNWGSVSDRRGFKVSFSKEKLKSTYKIVDHIDIDMGESVSFRGELLGLDLTAKRYRLYHLEDNQEYAGKVVDEALDRLKHSEINGIYKAELKKVTELYASSGQESVRWLLVDLNSES